MTHARGHSSPLQYLDALRPYQWIKNGFVLLPLIFGGKLLNGTAALQALIAALCFCFFSSAVYLLNDLADRPQDVLHPTKRSRPLAAGKIDLRAARWIACGLVALASVIAWKLDPKLLLVLGIYFLGNVLYTVCLKHIVIIDVMCLGLFFILRVLAGAVVIHVEVSEWLLICAGVLALLLGYGKRLHELRIVAGRPAIEHRRVLEKYSLSFLDQIMSVLTASTVIFYTLYTVDERTVAHFGTRSLLWTVPFVYYGVFRYLYLVHKRALGGDPARIVWKDTMLKLNLLLWVLTSVAVIYFRV